MDEVTMPVRYEMVSAHVAKVTLDRPDKRNAVNPELADALEAAVKRAEADRNVRAVVLTSSQDRAFCAGADLAAINAGRGRGIETAAGGFGGLAYAIRVKPWIAAVEGAALGGGLELVLACEMVIASTAAWFGLPEAKYGLIAAAGGVNRLSAMLPRAIANEMIATGDAIDAARAFHLGLVNQVVEPGEALGAAIALAERVAANSPLAVQYALQAGRASAALPDGAGRMIVAERFAALRLTDDFAEGPRAFVEKRPPVWTGR